MVLMFLSLMGMISGSFSTVAVIVFLEVGVLGLVFSSFPGQGGLFFILLNVVLGTLLMLCMYCLSIKKYSSDSCYSLLL